MSGPRQHNGARGLGVSVSLGGHSAHHGSTVKVGLPPRSSVGSDAGRLPRRFVRLTSSESDETTIGRERRGKEAVADGAMPQIGT